MGVFAPYDVATGLAMAPRWLWPTSAGVDRMNRAPLYGGTMGDGPRLVFAGDLMPLRGWAVPDVDPRIRAVVALADVFVANCEGPVSEKPARTGVPGFRRERATVAWLRDVLAALGGCWWPIEVTPGFMQKLALWLPTGWAMDAMHKLISFHAPASSVTANVIGLLVAALATGFVAARVFRYD